MIISSIGNGGNLAKTNISTSNASVNNAEISKDRKVKEGNDLKKKEPETPSTKKSSRSNLSKIRSLLNISLKIRKGKKIPKPLERLEESIVEDGELGKRPSGKLKIKSDNGVNQTDSILPLDRTQSDFTRQETRTAKEIPASLPLPPPNESTYIFGDDLTQGTAAPINYDPKILEVKVKRRIRLYAKISFCMTFIILSIIFVIFIIAMFGWWISFSAYGLLSSERLIRLTNGCKNDEDGLLMRQIASAAFRYQCNYRKISTLPWSSWTECFRSKMQSVQWRWRNLSSGLYLIDQQLINIKWC
uniref:Uncharacterized protein n=2 Tax=Loa loa TaxID=7209 RepID=A0A1I7VEM1_LOALO